MAATSEAEEFAGLLRGLKDRSGRSYGVLAGKLHVSTSTLHRYCNGDAIPTDYAPVERLARLCGATPDELVELHRRWILAVEARRRTRAEGSTASAPEPEPNAEARSVPEPSAGRREPDSPRSVPAPVSETAPIEGDTAQAPSGTRSRSPKRLRIVLAAAAVVALAVPTALIVGNRSDASSGEGPDSAATLSDGTTKNPDRGSGASASAAPSPSGSGKNTGPSSSGRPSGTPSASRPPKPGTGGGGVPLGVSISSYNFDAPCGQFYVLDQKPAAVPPPPAPQDTRGWAKALGGVDGGAMKLELAVLGKNQDAVVLHALHVRVVARNAPLQRSAYSMGDGCGGGITPQTFNIDLDDERPRAKPVAGTRPDESVVPARPFPYRVSASDPEVLDIDAHVEGHDVSWFLELEWSSGDRSGTLRIDDGGEPFRTSSLTSRPKYTYLHNTAEWIAY